MSLVSTAHYIHRDIVENDNWLRMYALAMFLCASCFIKCVIVINVRVGCQAAIANPSALQLTHPKLMAQYWDSWGKPSDGMLYGHTAFLDYYDECIDLKNTPVFQLAVV